MAPLPYFDQKQRQQAVVWLAQDVHGAYLERMHNLDDQIHVVRLWRDLAAFLNDWPGHTKIQRLLVEAWGERGPELLGEMVNENWKRFGVSLS